MEEEGVGTNHKAERQVAPEIPHAGWETLLVLHRHSAYDSGRPSEQWNPTLEDQGRLGRLTTVGREMAAERADERIKAILEQDSGNTYILIVNSPTYWLDNPKLGRRAQETADIIARKVLEELRKRGLSENHLLNTHPNPNETQERKTRFRGAEGSITKLKTGLRESQMFQYPEYVVPLREKYKGQGPDFWGARNADVDRELRERVGAPGPDDDARDINLAVAAEARYAKLWHAQPENAGKRLVIWNVTHGDGLVPYLQRVLHIPEGEFTADYNGGIGITIDSKGRAKTKVKGVEYQVPLMLHGKPASVQSNQ